ncbi:MAG: ATP-dependent Clp protease ATP-binding subunit [Alistipes sp.]|nr:ATP-dependent Clp protease ATP-binding subunit [Alistipes sp.]
MQINISKTLEGILARVTFQTTKRSIRHHLKDYLTLALIEEEGALAYQLLSERMQPWALYQLRLRIEQAVAHSPASTEEADPESFFRRFSIELTAHFTHVKRISTAHALLRIVSDPTTATAQALARYHMTEEQLRAALQQLETDTLQRPDVEVRLLDTLRGSTLTAPHTSLDRYGTDLTREAREGRIDPVIGRDREIERVIQILTRRKKNNPILLGEAGVGKTAIVEGLALRMVSGEVPYLLRGKRLFSLDLSSLIAGTKFRGEFEERMQQLIDELRRNREVILFIDEIHTIVGAGSTQGSLDTANILKPALARGELQTIGATTFEEYRREIERDSALERRFQRVVVEQPTPEETLGILQQIAPAYERHHRVRYTEEALKACVTLTDRYMSDRSFPDKAIDLMDEAGSRAHLQRSGASLADERLKALEEARYEEAMALRIEELRQRATLDEATEIGVSEVERLMTELTGIPLERITGNEAERLKRLHEHLAGRVIGQQEAVKRLSQAILRTRSGLKESHRPIGVFLFVGPTGVGKTLLAKELSRWLFDEKRGLIRLDMSEYSEKHNIARLIGSPPGYVGYGEGGQLTEAVRRRPYAVVLFDEIEKAHPEVFNTLLQLFDEGHLTDGSGRKVDFRNTVLVMTSNVGSRDMKRGAAQLGYTTLARKNAPMAHREEGYRKALEQTFAPEFLNRIDEVVHFRQLDKEDIRRILELELRHLTTRSEQLGCRLRITHEAKQHLIERGYEPRYGVRSLKRALQSAIETPLSELLVEGERLTDREVVIEHCPDRGIRLRVA